MTKEEKRRLIKKELTEWKYSQAANVASFLSLLHACYWIRSTTLYRIEEMKVQSRLQGIIKDFHQ
jgi:hypothetical protein